MKQIPIKDSSKEKSGWKGIGLLVLLSVLYLLYSWSSIGIRNDQLMLVAVVNVGYLMNGTWRRFVMAFSIFIVYWIIYDSMKLFPNFSFASVDIAGLYNLEKSIFGVSVNGALLTPNEYFIENHNAILDSLGAFFYLSWIPVPLMFAFFLFKKRPALYLRFALAFFLTNIVGFIIYYLHPAAPPWYVNLHGFILDESTKSYAAGLLRFDHLAGIKLFENMYSKGSNVFAALPSLHSAYPVLVFYYSYSLGNRLLSLIFFIFVLGIWFSAIYLSHHYILDVIAGLLCAIFSIFLFEKILMKLSFFNKWLKGYEKLIS